MAGKKQLPDGSRPHLEDAVALSLTALIRAGAIVPGQVVEGSLSWPGQQAMPFHADVGKDAGVFALGSQRIGLVSQPRHLGGRQWYFVCPILGRRCSKLYYWPQRDNARKAKHWSYRDGMRTNAWPKMTGFRSRQAVHPAPTYRSQRCKGCERATKQQMKLRRKLATGKVDPSVKTDSVRV